MNTPSHPPAMQTFFSRSPATFLPRTRGAETRHDGGSVTKKTRAPVDRRPRGRHPVASRLTAWGGALTALACTGWLPAACAAQESRPEPGAAPVPWPAPGSPEGPQLFAVVLALAGLLIVMERVCAWRLYVRRHGLRPGGSSPRCAQGSERTVPPGIPAEVRGRRPQRSAILPGVSGIALTLLSTIAAARAHTPGDQDTSFATGAQASNSVYALALQPNGQVLVGGGFTTFRGASRSAVARLNADGSLDGSFHPGGAGITANPYGGDVKASAVQGDGKTLMRARACVRPWTSGSHSSRESSVRPPPISREGA